MNVFKEMWRSVREMNDPAKFTEQER
jgi:hypothetical protein